MSMAGSSCLSAAPAQPLLPSSEPDLQPEVTAMESDSLLLAHFGQKEIKAVTQRKPS